MTAVPASDLILGKPAVEFILLQEERLEQCKKQIDRVASKSATKYLGEVLNAFKQFKGSEMILNSEKLEMCTNAYLLNISLPYYIAKWNLQITDYTRPSRLMPAGVYLASFRQQLIRLGIIVEGQKVKRVEPHQILVNKLRNADPTFFRKNIIDFLVSAANECKKLLKNTAQEVLRIRSDPRRRTRIQSYNLEEEANKIYVFEPLPIEPKKEEEEEEEEEEVSEDVDVEKLADFRAAIDLFVGAMGEAKPIEDKDATTYVPEDVIDFEAFKNMVYDVFKGVDPRLKPFFAAKMMQATTKELSAHFFRQLVRASKKPKQQSLPQPAIEGN